LILKATTRVDGVYDKDPLLHKDAKKYDQISYQKIVEQKLGIIDLTAAALCMSKKIPMRIFNMRAHSLLHAVEDSACGTLVTGE
jgi:uridylate kinase